MDEKGVYAIARSIWDDADFMQQKYTQREAWMWLIGAAVWKQTTINLDGRRVTLERGEFAFSIRFLAKKWKWAKTTVSRFLVTLEKRSMIRDTGRDKGAVFFITKYNDFQVVGLPRGTASGTASGTDAGQTRDKEETLQTLETLEPERAAPKGAVVPKPILPGWLDKDAWAAFLEMRRRKRAPVTARAIELLLQKLDRWRQKGHDPTAILDASTTSAWTDLYEPKEENANGRVSRKSNHETFFDAASAVAARIQGGQSAEVGGSHEATILLLPSRPDKATN